jgi:protein phosphatase slingshot
VTWTPRWYVIHDSFALVLQAVKLESVHSGRTRYLVVVSCVGRQDAEESCLLGIDCNEKSTVGLVLRVLADTAITLDGDG